MLMAATIPHIETITFTDWFLAIIDTPDIPIDEIEIRVAEGFKRKLTERQFQQLTELIHLISFIKHKKISNPTLALRIYVDENTSSLSRTALVEAVRMLPPEDNKTYELAAYLAQKNKLERYTNITKVPPLQIYQGDGVFEQYDEWILLFELFGLTQATPSDFIPAIAHLLIIKNFGIPDLRALSKFMSTAHKLGILSQNFMNNMTPHLCNGQIIEKYESLLLKLQINDLLNKEILETIYSLIKQLDALDAFFSLYHEELSHDSTLSFLREILPSFCVMSRPSKESYDDQVSTNTPLHLAVIESDKANLERTLAFANRNLLIKSSYENTALLLACKLADKESARLILAKMQELGCDVNQKDHHGMTALHWANFYHFDELIRELEVAGADPKLKAANGKTCEYFYQHQFTMNDLKLNGKEIIDGEFKLSECALTDIAFHMDKIALNLKLTTPSEIAELYARDEMAQIRSSNRFYLFFKLFRPKLINWLEKQNGLEPQVTYRFSGQSSSA
ncbi:TPA: Dot/Icm T4SS effector AnkQ/LegA10 [Legionella pneumophila]|uniref:Dot/Icm T4SS effector AnkQ/LegA10 n=1 Tax=Legionella pneumophila TaxID=446 RepID=UPI0009ADD06C|nr:Dot/Icm T4SS effector AnkQ/LegA10 [Legionella pneumophila]HAT8900042.1 Dot/Icm T4SS effector AnkQ/LegA10 [Legionella pneumophila subsp. pneumophila]HAT9970479.1 Dot/Icm T4SS effector AnkQ/LegA10 [Legionella pneumophila]HAT9976504.1 Dot/Icm T4SS effector AnkQ/LegA10 [Legionella pneumophila]HAU0027968.1 Dot/Icm T4SS effector AnkQ/LegA10 [Legionella pneumophila]HAU0030594.1 Dot/Icm T4SS effector AnkQ/LegA10 [Legionella pneumophila]